MACGLFIASLVPVALQSRGLGDISCCFYCSLSVPFVSNSRAGYCTTCGPGTSGPACLLLTVQQHRDLWSAGRGVALQLQLRLLGQLMVCVGWVEGPVACFDGSRHQCAPALVALRSSLSCHAVASLILLYTRDH